MNLRSKIGKLTLSDDIDYSLANPDTLTKYVCQEEYLSAYLIKYTGTRLQLKYRIRSTKRLQVRQTAIYLRDTN